MVASSRLVYRFLLFLLYEYINCIQAALMLSLRFMVVTQWSHWPRSELGRFLLLGWPEHVYASGNLRICCSDVMPVSLSIVGVLNDIHVFSFELVVGK